MIQHRYRTAALAGEWRETRRQACQDALRARQAYPDETEPDGVRWAVPGTIEMTQDARASETEPAAPGPAHRKNPIFGDAA
jgi:hypothetical protein